MDLQLTDKVALVTGGGKGIGRGIVEALLAEGAQVANVSRSPEERPPADCAGGGRESFSQSPSFAAPSSSERKGLPTPSYLFVQTDLTDLAACRSAVRQVIEHFGRLDIVVNNAGVNDSVGLDAGPDAFMESLRKNLVHFYAVVHYALDALKQSRGSIVNIGSKVSVTGQGGTSGYAAAKGGINALTREWAADLAPHGVRVNAVLPAETWTPLYERIINEQTNPTQAKEEIERLVPLERRFTTVEEMADMVVFLASPRSSHTTGQIIFVDGGYTHLDRKCTS